MKAKRQWYIARTNIKCEERASRSLRAAGYYVYTPMMCKTITHHRSKKRIDRKFKLFNRYIFMSVNTHCLPKVSAHDCDGVEEILGERLDGRPWPVPRMTVIKIMLAQLGGDFDSIIKPTFTAKDVAERFPVGSSIKVKRGATEHPFGGFYGQVTKAKGKGVVQAALSLFGSLVPVDLKYEDIEMDDAA